MAETYTQQVSEGVLDIFRVADLPSTHPGAFVEQGGKAIRTTTEQGFLCFGQYKQGYPVMPLQAVFSISIDNNTADDRNILLLDVYDHHSDRVIGKRVITRKDFAKAHEFCLFTFDFISPSQQANMEFRIYYMGHAFVIANKIAVIDPAKVVAVDPSRKLLTSIPAIVEPAIVEPPIVEPPIVAESRLPAPWKIAKIGNGNGKISQYNITRTEIDERKGALKYCGDFIVEATGSIQGSHDDFYFLYVKWSPESGNGGVAAKFSRQNGFVGVMFRKTLDPGSPFIMLEKDRVFYRKKPGGGIDEERLEHVGGDVCGLRLIRKRSGAEQFFNCGRSVDLSKGFTIQQKIWKFRIQQEAYVGLAVTTATATVGVGFSYKDEV